MGRNDERTTGIRIRKTQETLEKVTFKCETTGVTKEGQIKKNFRAREPRRKTKENKHYEYCLEKQKRGRGKNLNINQNEELEFDTDRISKEDPIYRCQVSSRRKPNKQST